MPIGSARSSVIIVVTILVIVIDFHLPIDQLLSLIGSENLI